MPSPYCVRLLIADPAGAAHLIISGAPSTLSTWGPKRYISGWAVNTVAGALDAREVLVTFTDPVGGAISNVDSILLRVCGEHRYQVAFVGIAPASACGASLSPSLLEVPLAAPALAWPGGRILCEPNSPLTVAPGALTFQLS